MKIMATFTVTVMMMMMMIDDGDVEAGGGCGCVGVNGGVGSSGGGDLQDTVTLFYYCSAIVYICHSLKMDVYY